MNVSVTLLTVKKLCPYLEEKKRFVCKFYLLSYLLAVQLSNSRQNLANNKNLEALVIAKDTNQAVINPNASSLKSNSKESFKMAPAIKFTRALRFVNIMLAANLIFLSNDVALNPGPIDLRVSSHGRGIRIGQWNIGHLTDAKFEQFSLSLNAHKDSANNVDVRILTETFCAGKDPTLSIRYMDMPYSGRTELVSKGEE